MNSELKELEEEMLLLNEQERFEYIIDLGKELKKIPNSEKNEKNKISGCTSEAYIKIEKSNNKIDLQGDADSIIVKGYINILKKILNNKTQEYVENEFENDIKKFIEKTKLNLDMLPSRANAFGNMIKHIKDKSAN
ncbi:SufE family protein [Candidatus Woesearchaeota archaeon]|nr:SufE family protein [Candidatus Woesearchaeota archaeon]MCF8014012.1 SufE family protein [Candidatus Woesearchaeota archaeon]